MITYVIINNFLQADTSLLSLLLFRLAVNGIAFFLAYLMKSEMKLYQTAIGLTVILLALDLVIIFTGLDIITMLHPVVNFKKTVTIFMDCNTAHHNVHLDQEG